MSDKKYQRLVYSPKAYAFIYSRRDGGSIVDVSNDISGGSVQRFVNKPSTATLTLRNDNWKYTGRFNPMFYPMDGITIWLQRYAGIPIQVFTGFIDSIPYYQAYPGEIEIKATCTLKQFMYMHFDPGVGFLDWLTQHNWVPNGNGNLNSFYNPEALEAGGDAIGTDGGMGQILHDFMIDIAGVDKDAMVIGDLPEDLPKTMLEAYAKRVSASEAAQNSLIVTLGNFLTLSATQEADASPDDASKFPTGIATNAKSSDIKSLLSTIPNSQSKTRPSELQMILAGLVMSGLDKTFDGKNKNSPSYGKGFFADPTIAKDVGPKGKDRGGKKDLDTKAQGEKFCKTWADVIGEAQKQTTVTEELVTQTARVLAYGYGKEKFFGEILEACNNSSTLSAAQKILDNIKANQSLESVKSLDVITAGEVVEEIDPLNVTWDSIFESTNASASDAIVVGQDGKKDNGPASIEKGEVYSTKFSVYAPKENLVPVGEIGKIKTDSSSKGVQVSYKEVKYYIHAVWSGKTVDNSSGGKSMTPKFAETSELEIGQIVEIYNPRNEKRIKCVYLGIKSGNKDANAAFTISPDAVEALGGTNKNNGFVTTDLNFQITEETIPAPPQVGTNGDTLASLKKNYVKSLNAALGQRAEGASTTYVGLNINEQDKEAYNNYYKAKPSRAPTASRSGANQRLAQYFYIASNYDLHLMNFERTHENRLFLSGEPSQIVEFLKNIGIAKESSSVENGLQLNTIFQSRPKGVQVTLNGGGQYYAFGTDRQPTIYSTPDAPEPIRSAKEKNIEGIIIIEASTNDPKPVWNGKVVRLPEATVNNEDAEKNAKSAVTWADVARVATSAAFATLTQFPWDLVGSSLLIGEKSLMNDIPVIQGIDQLCKGSMRHYMSLPNGMFCAFYPDHFGRFGRKPYMSISDLEIMDFNIVLNDEPIVTHMYVNGQTVNPLVPNIDEVSRVMSVGVITIEDALSGTLNIVNKAGQTTGTSGDAADNNDGEDQFKLENEATPYGYPQFYDGLSKESLEFLQIYGTRPKVQDNPLIRSPWFEFSSAYNEFAYNWSMHTATTAVLTFMPEIMAGGLVEFENQNVVMYVEGVNHTWSYTSGFETSAFFSAPSTKEEGAVPGLVLFRSRP